MSTFDESELVPLQRALLGNDAALRRLQELRGWTKPALERLGVGLLGDRLAIPYRDERGVPSGLMKYQPNPDKLQAGEPKTISTTGSTRELFPAPETLDRATVLWLVEGEPDSITAHSIGLEATGLPGSTSWRTEWAPRFKDRHVVICCDCDEAGRRAALVAAESLFKHAASVRIIDLDPARSDGYDLSDFVDRAPVEQHVSIRELLAQLVEAAPAFIPDADRPPSPRVDLARYQRAVIDHLNGVGVEPAWPVPLTEVRMAMEGGIRPGEVWVVGGWTSHGKSVYADMIGDTTASAGARVHGYLTEQTIRQRGLRHLSRVSGFAFRDLRSRTLSEDQIAQAIAEVTCKLRWACTPVTDWTPAQVVADIRAHRTNVAIVDLLHGFHYHDERDLSAIVKTFRTAVTTDVPGSAGTAVVLVAHLNEKQMPDKSVKRPRPALHSLKGAGSIKQDADGVIFVWREDDDNGRPTADGEIWVAKNRNGDLGDPAEVTLNYTNMTFERRY